MNGSVINEESVLQTYRPRSANEPLCVCTSRPRGAHNALTRRFGLLGTLVQPQSAFPLASL